MAEHNADARKQSLTPWGQHFRTVHPTLRVSQNETVFESVSVIARVNDQASRRLREAVEIRNKKPEINLNAGWKLI